MRIGACFHALVTTSAAVEVEHQQTLRIHQALTQEVIHRYVLQIVQTAAILFETLLGYGLEALAHLREALDHSFKVVATDLHKFNMIERRASRGAKTFLSEQSDL